MTIRNQLYKGFGILLLILGVLLIVDLGALWKARSASGDASATLEAFRTAGAVRNKIMENRLNLNNFLLSGDPRDEDKVNRGFGELSDLVKRGQSLQSQNGSDIVKTALFQVESTETSWADNLAKPLLAKRHQVDSGDVNVSHLHILYLQKAHVSWLAKSSAVLDQANKDVESALTESQNSARNASFWAGVIILAGTLF